MYAFGLGPTTPLVPEGQPAPNPPAVANGSFSLSFAYTSGADPAAAATPFSAAHPLFIGLTPGQVGLYQVNFRVPPPTGPISGCDGNDQANLRVILHGQGTIDTASICVAPGAAQ